MDVDSRFGNDGSLAGDASHVEVGGTSRTSSGTMSQTPEEINVHEWINEINPELHKSNNITSTEQNMPVCSRPNMQWKAN